ncbi:MAG: TM1812 family CRISPR-associated protein [Alicyclobacillus sp.]|nr:TM1812 family CRISPR-associated protein [Alicyclobacillus sp.]
MAHAKRVFITFLGTSEYKVTRYSLGDIGARVNTPFVQEALLSLMDDGVIDFHPDVVMPVLTREAEAANWHWRNGFPHNPDDPESWGLAPRLEAWVAHQREKGRDVAIDPVRNDSTHDEEAMWDTFDALYQRIARDGTGPCEVVVDVTHSFRYQPMLILSLVHLARVVAGTKTIAVFYGAQPRQSEAPANGAPSSDSSILKAPIVDLSPLVELQEWILHVHTFLHGANAEGLWRFVKDQGFARDAYQKQDPRLPHIREIERLVEQWRALTQSIQLCRGPKLQEVVADSLHLQNRLETRLADGEAIPSLRPVYYLLGTVRSELKPLAVKDRCFPALTTGSPLGWVTVHRRDVGS